MGKKQSALPSVGAQQLMSCTKLCLPESDRDFTNLMLILISCELGFDIMEALSVKYCLEGSFLVGK